MTLLLDRRFSMLSADGSIRKCLCIFLMCVLTESAMSFHLASSSSICQLDFKTFLHDLNSQCPFSNLFSSSPIQVFFFCFIFIFMYFFSCVLCNISFKWEFFVSSIFYFYFFNLLACCSHFLKISVGGNWA